MEYTLFDHSDIDALDKFLYLLLEIELISTSTYILADIMFLRKRTAEPFNV